MAVPFHRDGLLLPGGEDVDPRYFGEDPSPKLGRITGYYDRAWIAALEYAAEQGMPVLGICRGHQLANAVFGGTLYQDLSEYPPPPRSTRTPCTTSA